MNEEEGGNGDIIEVWDSNFLTELDNLSAMVPDYPYLAMDTEFPGIAERDQSDGRTVLEAVTGSVNETKIIQLGISIFNSKGQCPPTPSTWQFNFKFDLRQDRCQDHARDMLDTAGIDFGKLSSHGIDHQIFAENFTTSGLVLSDEVTWIVFHGAYDFSYCLKTLTGENLPSSSGEFDCLLNDFFPSFYDIKYILINQTDYFRMSLSNLAKSFNVDREGTCHQAGSDSKLTGNLFFKMSGCSVFSQKEKYRCKVFGLEEKHLYRRNSGTENDIRAQTISPSQDYYDFYDVPTGMPMHPQYYMAANYSARQEMLHQRRDSPMLPSGIFSSSMDRLVSGPSTINPSTGLPVPLPPAAGYSGMMGGSGIMNNGGMGFSPMNYYFPGSGRPTSTGPSGYYMNGDDGSR